jgi:PAS domain S-box-containing protein
MRVITEKLEEQAALYAAGALTAEQRSQFELILEFHVELRARVREFEEVTVAAQLATLRPGRGPSAGLKQRIFGMLDDRVQQQREAGFVLTDENGLVEWVNPAFTAMCGFSLEELKGRKLGPLLRGELTDKAAIGRMRDAIQTKQPCSEALVNYHKDGRPYWVSINIQPILEPDGSVICFAAREVELPERFITA